MKRVIPKKQQFVNQLFASDGDALASRKAGQRVPFSIDSARAFTVKPIWGWLIMRGYKDVENRSTPVEPANGICVVSCSKTYTEAEHRELLAMVKSPRALKNMPPYGELKALCGKAIGMVNYDVVPSSASEWYDGRGVALMLSRPRAFRHPFDMRGGRGMWRMSVEDARLAFEQLGGLWR